MANTDVREKVGGVETLLVWSLSPDEQQYVFDVLDGVSLTEAYQRCHPDVKRTTARVQGSWWLTRPNIRNARDEIVGIMAREAYQGLKALAPKCLSVLAKGLDGPDAERYALAVLDRIGIGPHMGLDVSQSRINGLDEFLEATRVGADRDGA